MIRCDCHVHVVEDIAVSPMVPSRMYTPPAAPLAALQAMAKPQGVTRFVVVQPSFYGTDNRLLLRTLDELEGNGRGVAVIHPAGADPGMLRSMHASGVRGLRINLYSSLSAQQPRSLEQVFESMAQVAGRMGWHVEVLAELPLLLQKSGLLATAGVPVVIDHFGLHAGYAPSSPEGQDLLDLLRLEHVWIKLSAPYRTSPDELATRPDPTWLAAILEAAEERCVWGSDWPHTPAHALQTGGGVPLPYRTLDYAKLVAGFRAAIGDVAGDASLAELILTKNAARLYGFEQGNDHERHPAERNP